MTSTDRFFPRGYDYSHLADPESLPLLVADRASSEHEYYRSAGSYDYRFTLYNGRGLFECIKITDDILIVLSQSALGSGGKAFQSTSDGDWLHIQFRISGGGREGLDVDQMIQTPSGFCATIRVPADSTIIREYTPEKKWKALCIYMRPKAVWEYFEISPSAFSDDFRWISDGGRLPLCADVMPLPPTARQAVADMFECPYLGDVRRTYMRAKVLELFSVVAARFCDTRAEPSARGRPTTGVESEKVEAVIQIMRSEIETQTSLRKLARRVGLNRTKLAEAFREHSGSTVQAYWRDLRLAHARELLKNERLPVTEVAARVGYSNISSLTRAFMRRYGVLPKDIRRQN